MQHFIVTDVDFSDAMAAALGGVDGAGYRQGKGG